MAKDKTCNLKIYFLNSFQGNFGGKNALPAVILANTKQLQGVNLNYQVMTFTKLVPNVFYADIKDALKLFIDCLGFSIQHDELTSATPFCVIEKDGLRINLFENKVLAKEHHPEFRLVTNNIVEVYEKVTSSHAAFLHPNLSKITLRPWGAKEFAIMDKQLGVIIQQW